MRKTILAIAATFIYAASVSAQSIKETFDSNSLNWNECAVESHNGMSIIENGVLTITSKGINKFWSEMLETQVGENTYFTCFCYAPLNVQRPFKVSTNVTIGRLGVDKLVGLVFNYRDDGNFYAFVFNDNEVSFLRYENMKLIGAVTQSMKWNKKHNVDQNWRLESDGSTLSFFVDELAVMNVRYMPLEYEGFGYYTFGKQKLIVDDVEFFQ